MIIKLCLLGGVCAYLILRLTQMAKSTATFLFCVRGNVCLMKQLLIRCSRYLERRACDVCSERALVSEFLSLGFGCVHLNARERGLRSRKRAALMVMRYSCAHTRTRERRKWLFLFHVYCCNYEYALGWKGVDLWRAAIFHVRHHVLSSYSMAKTLTTFL